MVKAVGKVEIVAQKFDKMAGSDLILVQTSADVTAVGLPASIDDPGGREEERGAQQAGSQAELPAVERRDFRDRVLSFLRNEGKEWSDLENLISPRHPVKVEGSELASALTSLANKAAGSRRKRRVFSGVMPTPEGEKEYEMWVEQTSRSLGEWQCSDDEKRQRLVKSLRGLAADISGVTVNQPSASVAENLEALESAAGMTGSTLELVGEFQNMCQEKGEKLSSYLFQLERRLNYLRRRGGIQVAEVDQLQTDQIAKGTQSQDMIAWGFRQSGKVYPLPHLFS
ncbi:paraneoplastic antigen Ma1 homolog [Mobula birostris]|uniref:paraneoplastic antigen Ma1 homolog n=1 Tax=Mobula birostris TaxID=1983395 RepID=UPI003B2805CF